MYELEIIGNVFTSKFVGTGPSSYEKRIYRAAVSQRLRNPVLYLGTVADVTFSLWLLVCGIVKRETARVSLLGGSGDPSVRRSVQTGHVAFPSAHPMHTCVFSLRGKAARA
jgi:hypothetical protein